MFRQRRVSHNVSSTDPHRDSKPAHLEVKARAARITGGLRDLGIGHSDRYAAAGSLREAIENRYLREWVGLVLKVRAALSRHRAAARVQIAINIITLSHDEISTRRDGFDDDLLRCATAVLLMP